jgi:hypothetical protein
MIISASRRTDIPAFYSEWFMNRIRAGFCTVPNPVRKDQISRVSLKPEDVDVIVFWTRNPVPLMKHLDELDKRGYCYCFQYTIMDNPRVLDPRCPAADDAIESARRLSGRIGPEKVIWRYDPIVFAGALNAEFHKKTYERIAGALRGHAHCSVISVVDVYRKIGKRLRSLAENGFELTPLDGRSLEDLMRSIAGTAKANGMEVFTCAEETDFSSCGIPPGKCIDDAYIARVFGLKVPAAKDPSQRKACGCVVSRDIGAYDSCLFGCAYCYATSSFERAKENHQRHDPASASLISA